MVSDEELACKEIDWKYNEELKEEFNKISERYSGDVMGKIIFKITIVILAICLIKEIYSRGVGIYKVAVFERNIKDEQYILCKGERTTGFDRCMIKDETGEECSNFSEVIRVVGIKDPSNTENYALSCGDNTYVFYITG